MTRPTQFSPQARGGPSPAGRAGADQESRERIRETAYRPDGSVAGVRERELWQVWRQPVAALPPGSQLPASLGVWESLKEAVVLFAGIHVLLSVAIAGGALAGWVGWNPVAGYAGVWFLIYWFLIRPKL